MHPAGAIAVQQYAKRQLEQREGAEIGRREKPQLGRRQPQVTHQIGGDHGIHRAEQVGHEIGRAKGSSAERTMRRGVMTVTKP